MRNLNGKTAGGKEVALWREVSGTKFNAWEWHVATEDSSKPDLVTHSPDEALKEFNSRVAPEFKVK
jgi:hypothetical protein